MLRAEDQEIPSSPTGVLNLLLTDSHAAAAQLMIQEFKKMPGIIARHAQSLNILREELAASGADIVLLDYDLPGMRGVDSLYELTSKFSDSKFVIYYPGLSYIGASRAIELGAFGYIPKSTTFDGVLAAVNYIACGEIFMPSQIVRQSYNARSDKGLGDLDIELLRLAKAGVKTKNIASELSVSESTVKMHFRKIFSALKANNRPHAVSIALELGIIT